MSNNDSSIREMHSKTFGKPLLEEIAIRDYQHRP